VPADRAFTLDKPRLKHIRTASLIPNDTSLENNLSRIKSWIRLCAEHHPRCSHTNSYVPFRLLNINPDLESIKLVELLDSTTSGLSAYTEDSLINFRYVCLSHCWGQTRSRYMTTRNTLAGNLSSIPICELPKTFQDAVDVTRKLGIDYLWIDSLCIIQDDEQDWATHMSVMDKIYRYAYVTLAAAAAIDDEGGFFTKTDIQYTETYHFRLTEDETEHEIHIRNGLHHPDADWPSREVMPLMRRGWVVQERVLSRRYLFFGTQELLWECLEDVACSCSMAEESFNNCLRGTDPSFINSPATKIRFSRLEELTASEIAEEWRDLVQQYCSRDLTFPADKLPALTGLANAFQVSDGSFAEFWYSQGLKTVETTRSRGS
jgi:hypothetical protein